MKNGCFICTWFYSIIPFAITQKRFEIESLYFNNLLVIYHLALFLKSILEFISWEYSKEQYYFKIFTCESIKACGFANMVCFNQQLNLLCFSELRYRNNKIYFQLLLLLSGDISLNPGPINGSQQYYNDKLAVFKRGSLHFVHININSLLPKIDKLHLLAFQN